MYGRGQGIASYTGLAGTVVPELRNAFDEGPVVGSTRRA